MKPPTETTSAPATAHSRYLDDVPEITAVEVIAGHGLALSRRPLDEMHGHEVEISPLFSFISAGTELHALRELSRAGVGSHPPARMGYSQCGVVTRVGEAVRDLAVGDRVVAIGAGAFHATRTVVAQNLVVPLPEGVCPQAASLAAMFCFALEGAHKSAVRVGENVVVFGAGMMGQMAARIYRLSGARVCVMDSNAFRLGLLPAGTTTFPLDDGGWKQLAAWARPHGVEHASICFGGDATEVIEKLKPCMSVAPDGVPHGRIVFPGGAKITVLMASNMGNIQLVSSAKAGPGYRDSRYESGADYPAVYVPHTVRRNVETMLSLMGDGRLDLSKLVTHRFAFPDAKNAYAMLQQPDVEALAVLLEY
ncbi:alcohol dehydrogenase [Opitutaceae bacterium TAV5]|nr:alcohol dehydrogenase [Opitutaceae bacterium TAV5]